MTSLSPEDLERNRCVIIKDIVKDVPIVEEVARFLRSKMYDRNNIPDQTDASNNSFDEDASNKLIEVGQELAKIVPTPVVDAGSLPQRREREEDHNNNLVAVDAVATILVLNFDASTSTVNMNIFADVITRIKKRDYRENTSVLQWVESLELFHQDLNIAIRDAINNFNNNTNLITGDDKTNLEVVWKYYCDKLLKTSLYIKNRPLPPPSPISIFDAITARHDKYFARSSDFSEALKEIGVKVAIDDETDSLRRRFVRPVGSGKLFPVPLQLELQPNEPNPSFESSKNNVVVGFSGAGKTIVPFTQAATWNEADLQKPNAEKGFVVYAVVDWDLYSDLFENRNQPKLKCTKIRNKRAVEYLLRTVCVAISWRSLPSFPSHTDSSQSVTSYIESLNQPQDNNNNNNGMSIADALRIACASSIPNSQLQTRCLRHRLYIALDELGHCPLLVSGLCAVWNDVRIWLARHVFLMNPDKLFLTTIGTGVRSTFAEPASTFAVFTVNTRCLFREHLRSLASANTTSQNGKQLIERFDTALFERVPDDYHAGALQDGSIFFSVPLLNNNNTDEHPVPFRIRVTGAEITRYRFAQVVTFNARTATIAAACLHLVVSNTNLDITKMYLQLSHGVAALFAAGSKFLQPLVQDTTTNDHAFNLVLHQFSDGVVAAYKELNALSGRDAMIHIARALRVAMSRRTTIEDFVRDDLCSRYGLLRQLPDETFEMSPSFTAMFLLNKKLIAPAAIGAGEVFKHLVAEHHALVLLLLPFHILPEKINNKFITIFQEVWLKEKRQVAVETLPHCLDDKSFGQPNKQMDEAKNSWRSKILRYNAVVLVNGPEASFADVIVLAPGRIFLTQCKYYCPNSKCDAEGEFKKMRTDNPETMKLLIDCCKINDKKIEVKCSIVFKFQDPKNVSPAYEPKSAPIQVPDQGFSYTEHFLYVFPFAEKDAQDRLWSESNMFPVLAAPFEPQQEEAEAK